MTRTKSLLLLAAVIVAASCAPVDVPPPAVTPQGDDRYLIDPRTGIEAAIPTNVAPKFEAAWRYVVAGNDLEAQRRLAEIQKTNPDLAPVLLANAAMSIKAGRFDVASNAIAEALARAPESVAARVYEAEIALRQGHTRPALAMYEAIAAGANAPAIANERITFLRETLFNELVASAQTASDPEAARLLREALSINEGATETRLQLARRLLSQKRFDEARKELDPLLNTIADHAEVQELLAEIEVGRGRYQEAILRYDRLARRTKDPRYERRLDEIKQEWSAANMPAHFRTALDSVALTRAELATLLYWTVPSIRFAQNLSTPPIAVDIEDVQGREEMIRAIALGLYDVDPVTRRVGPSRQVTASRLSALLARLLVTRGAACARGVAHERVLAACAVTDPLTTYTPDATVMGSDAQKMLEQLAKQL